MTARRTVTVLAAALLLGAAAFFFFPRRAAPPPTPRPRAATAATTPETAAAARARETAAALAALPPPGAGLAFLHDKNTPPADTAPVTGPSPIAAALNAPGGTLRRDLEIIHELFGAFHTNFPRTGNPVGDNAEITAALVGANPVRYAFLDPQHPAINARGELCDRWGTPFRFHQLSGTQMEIRSAGPDQKFGTPDDAEFTPPNAIPR
ncbi:MAG: hypothetical protein RLZZ15_1547 [Verrucomicrobiota bacterium]|jgi:hypothetical protein